MRRVVLAGTMILLLCFCRPSDETFTDDQMVNVLTDMILVDELLAKYGGVYPDNYRDSLKMMLLDKHSLSSNELDSIMLDVQKDLKRYHVIQSRVAEKLDSLKKDVESR